MVWKTVGILLVAASGTLLPAQGLTQSDQEATSTTVASDTYGRISPRGMVDGYLKAMREADLEKVALFLDISGLSEAEAARSAMRLKQLLDDGGYFFLTDKISSSPEGNLSDEMSADLEEVGALQSGRLQIPLILQRVPNADGRYIWLFSQATIGELPALHQSAQESLLNQILPDDLKSYRLLTVPIGHWLAMVIVAMIAAALGLVLARALLRATTWILTSKVTGGTVLDVSSVLTPLGVVIAVVLYREVVILIGVQVVARGATDWIAVTILWLGVAVLCLKLVDLVADVLRSVLQPEEH